LFDHYPEVINFWKKNKIRSLGRAAFFKLEPGGIVERHIDEGEYYLTRDRYHLSLQSTYHYTVGDEEMIVEPGTFFWFHNKIPHGAKNIGNVDRISLVFDVPHHRKNPHHSVNNAKGFG
jgi:quercetin dioxygenase-like cupin family protein